MRPLDEAIVELCTRQHDVAARRQLLRLDYSGSAIDRLLRKAWLHSVFMGVYTPGTPGVTLHGRVMAAVLACGDEALVNHRCAGFVHDLCRPSRMEVIRPGKGRRSPKGIVVQHVRELHPGDRTTVDAIPVTSLAFTLLQLGAGPGRFFRRAWDEAERRGLFDLREIEATLQRHPRHPGRRAVERLIEENVEPPDLRSEMEQLFWEVILDEQLTFPEMNFPLGPYTVDAYWPHANLVVELDSRTFHERRMAFEEDRERDGYLLEHYDIRVYRITWNALTRRRGRVVARLRRLLATT